MKLSILSAVSALVLLLTFSLRAQAPLAVPATSEPHHHLVIENPYLRALRVSIPSGDATLLHEHKAPYVFVSLGPADFSNEVAGKPEARVKMVDGQVGYSRGGFVHLVRTDADEPFNNITVELLHAQGEPRNLCDKIVPSDLGACAPGGDEPNAPIGTRPLMETDEIRVDAITVRRNGEVMDKPHARPGLLMAVSGAPIKVARIPGVTTQTLHAGEMMWLPSAAEPKFTVEDGPEARLVLISFKD
jgi:hypothetical protein